VPTNGYKFKMTTSTVIWKALYSSFNGVDHAIPGNGGINCYNFLTMKQRVTDTLVFTLWASLFIIPLSLRSLSLPTHTEIINMCRTKPSQGIHGGRKCLLVSLCLIFGVEIGFKIVSESWIYLLNPCHVITSIQIYLLCSEPSRVSMTVFRIHWHLLFGPLLASLFPVTNTRKNAMEIVNYWLQHGVITFLVPPYLLSTGGAFTCEPLWDFSWNLITIPVFGVYMYYILQGFGMLSLANLNNMLCPAISDPFFGPNYRWFAFVHQQLLILAFGKIYYFVLWKIIKLKDYLWPPQAVLSNNNNNNVYSVSYLDKQSKLH